MEPSEPHAAHYWNRWWFLLCIILVIVAILLIAFLIWCCRKSSFGRVWPVIPYGTLSRTLLCQVECYGQGQIHHEVVRKLKMIPGPGAPVVLFVYKVSRETEDLRNALQWIEDKRGRNRDDIRAVILLEKSLDNQKKPAEVVHQGMFGANTVVVRILWQQQWNSPGTILDSGSNKEAMEKVKQSILRCP